MANGLADYSVTYRSVYEATLSSTITSRVAKAERQISRTDVQGSSSRKTQGQRRWRESTGNSASGPRHFERYHFLAVILVKSVWIKYELQVENVNKMTRLNLKERYLTSLIAAVSKDILWCCGMGVAMLWNSFSSHWYRKTSKCISSPGF